MWECDVKVWCESVMWECKVKAWLGRIMWECDMRAWCMIQFFGGDFAWKFYWWTYDNILKTIMKLIFITKYIGAFREWSPIYLMDIWCISTILNLVHIEHYQLLKMILLNLNSSVLLAQVGNFFQYSASWAGQILDFSVFVQLTWASTEKYRPSSQSNTEY